MGDGRRREVLWDQRVRHSWGLCRSIHIPSGQSRSSLAPTELQVSTIPQSVRMHLPGKFLDEIFGHLPSDRGRSSMHFSLVPKSWLEPSRRFPFLHISNWRDSYRSRFGSIPPRNTGLLRYLRSLTHFLRAEGRASRLESRLGRGLFRKVRPVR